MATSICSQSAIVRESPCQSCERRLTFSRATSYFSDSPARPEMPVAIVTGASGGIGREIALELGRQGFSLGLVARTESRLHDIQGELARGGFPAVVAAADVTDAAAVDDAVATIVDALGPV